MYVVQVDTVERQSLLATRNNWVMDDLLSIVDFCPLMWGVGTGIVDFVGRAREKRQADFFLGQGGHGFRQSTRVRNSQGKQMLLCGNEQLPILRRRSKVEVVAITIENVQFAGSVGQWRDTGPVPVSGTGTSRPSSPCLLRPTGADLTIPRLPNREPPSSSL